MPAPTSIAELLELTRKSQVVEESRLQSYMQQLTAAGAVPNEPSRLAGLMVRDGILTLFQAEQLLNGKWKRFTIGKYKVLEKLGSGGMGQVYLCEHKVMRRRVALKVLPTAKAEDESSRERFYREARCVAALDHPNIVRAYDIDQDENLHYLVMEFVDGASLQEMVKRTGPMDPLRACHYMLQAAHGLQHAFDQACLIHRDIKPGNILVDRTGVVKILDMGLARFFHDEDDLLTKKYDENVLGTADYLAPEQAIDSHSVDIRADIYSLGATFYFLLTGSPPFTEGTVAQKLIWHQTKEPKPILAIRPDVPPEVVAIVEKMMAKDAANRPQLPKDLAAMLEPLTLTPIPVPPEEEMPRLSLAATGPVGSSSVGPPTRIMSPPTPRPMPPAVPRSDPPAPKPISAGRTPAPAPVPLPTPRPVHPGNAPLPPIFAPAPLPMGQAHPVGPLPAQPIPSAAPAHTASEDGANLWSAMTDTPNPKAHSETLKSNPTYRAPSATMKAPKMPGGQRGGSRWLIWVGAGILLAAIGVGGAFALGLFGKKSGGPVIPGPGPNLGAPPLIVDTTGGGQPGTFRRVGDALIKAKPGDTILVRGPHVEEIWDKIDRNRIAKNVTIEPESKSGEPMVWRLPASAPLGSSVIDLTNVDGLTFRHFVFDGQNSAKSGIYLTLRCPGVTFENVRIKNCKEAAIKLSNATGEAERPIVFRNVTGSGPHSAAAVYLHANRSISVQPACEHVVVEDCLFEGPANALIQIEGSITDVVIRRNRLAGANNGVIVKLPKEGEWYDLVVQNNTIANVRQNGVQWEGPVQPEAGKPVRFEITRNYFSNCKVVAFSPDGKAAGAVFSGNARDKRSSEGNVKAGVREMDFQFPNEKSGAGADFLRYPKTAVLATGAGGPVGAPPE